MTITAADLQTLTIAYQGQPFVHVVAGDFDTYELDTAYLGQPFIAAEGEQATDEITVGDGYPIRIQKKKKKHKRINDVIDRAMSDLYEDVEAIASPQAKKEAASIVKPFATGKVQAGELPSASVIDWAALERNAAAVSALLILWQRQVEYQRILQEEDEMLILLAM